MEPSMRRFIFLLEALTLQINELRGRTE